MGSSPKTALGERLLELRRRIVAIGTPLCDWDELIDVELPARIAEAVEAEKKRWVTLLTKAKDVAIKKAEYPLACSLRDCRDAGICWAPEPEPLEPPPPADEPMTVEKLATKWAAFGGCIWQKPPAFKADLTDLVKDQARQDASTCLGQQNISRGSLYDSACRDCHDAILRTAGL